MKPLLFALSFLAGIQLMAQQPSPSPTSSPDEKKIPLWTCKMPGGTYEVALRAVISVSSHEYTVDNAARVTEVNVDTTGNLLVRFYYLEPQIPQSPMGLGQSTMNKLDEMVTEAAARTGQEEIWKKVVKSYPATTHSRTVEYRVSSKEELNKIYESAATAFRTGKTATVSIQ
jgi:hypothetical protein